jgi:hypothetical protein
LRARGAFAAGFTVLATVFETVLATIFGAFAVLVDFVAFGAFTVLAGALVARAFVVFGALAAFVDFAARRAVPERFVLAVASTVAFVAEARFLAVVVFFVFAMSAIVLSFVFSQKQGRSVCPDESTTLA